MARYQRMHSIRNRFAHRVWGRTWNSLKHGRRVRSLWMPQICDKIRIVSLTYTLETCFNSFVKSILYTIISHTLVDRHLTPPPGLAHLLFRIQCVCIRWRCWCFAFKYECQKHALEPLIDVTQHNNWPLNVRQKSRVSVVGVVRTVWSVDSASWWWWRYCSWRFVYSISLDHRLKQSTCIRS